VFNDVSFSGRGRSLDFARLLDQLARENPYFSLQEFSIKASPHPADPECDLSWTLRLYMLEDQAWQAHATAASDPGDLP
jgi:hypothetical protein